MCHIQNQFDQMGHIQAWASAYDRLSMASGLGINAVEATCTLPLLEEIQ